ncbi:MAG: ribosome silencing factor [Acidimicrobiia bacterium]|nr:ribosome silencing factor [Acidimicrobiia bacterium]
MERTEVAELARVAAQAADAKSGRDTLVIDVGDVLAITDYFVITSGANDRQVKSIVDEVELQLRDQCGVRPARVEGLDDRSWVLLDYGSFVVHVFLDETRQFYELERLWRDVPRLAWEPAEGASPRR